MDYFSDSQIARKRVVTTTAGVVASQHKVAAQVGAEVLRAGGDAVDAAVATSFALGVVEPWMSGMAAGGCMVLWRAKEQRAYAVNFGMRSPMQLNAADYPLSGLPPNTDLFPWASVVDDRNVRGATAVAIPGVVAGMQLAHERFGRASWRELVMPAVGLAQQGMAIDWYSALLIASSARWLAEDADAARMFLDDGHWPKIGSWAADANQRLDQSVLAQSLRAVADDGAAAFYGGDVGKAMVRDIRDKGGCMSVDDLRHYRAEWVEPLEIAYRGGSVLAV
ncbi:MAG: gamma-glutamyltransferase, partial [Betaproteobacteria bacterium]|nr:gamma-glutamyltransferase [Betaproteobacteria bacterium]